MKTFFLAYEQADVPCIAPVLSALAERSDWEPVFVPGLDYKEGRDSLAEAQAPIGIPTDPLDWMPTGDGGGARRGRELLERCREWGRAGSAAALGTAKERLVRRGLAEIFGRHYMPAVVEAYAATERALDSFARRQRPPLVVLPEDTDYLRGRLAARVLRRHGTIVVCLVPADYGRFVSYPLLGRRDAHHYLVPTEAYRDRLVSGGVPAARIDVVGIPSFDALPVPPSPPAEPTTFVLALQGLAWETEILADLLDVFASRPRARLVVKPHPLLPVREALPPGAASTNVVVAAPDAPAAELVASAACVIGQSSSLLYEASVRGRAVILVHYAATPLPIDVPADDGDLVARTRRELRLRVDEVLASRGRGLRRTSIAPFYPHATLRAVGCLEKVREQFLGTA